MNTTFTLVVPVNARLEELHNANKVQVRYRPIYAASATSQLGQIFSRLAGLTYPPLLRPPAYPEGLQHFLEEMAPGGAPSQFQKDFVKKGIAQVLGEFVGAMATEQTFNAMRLKAREAFIALLEQNLIKTKKWPDLIVYRLSTDFSSVGLMWEDEKYVPSATERLFTLRASSPSGLA